MRVLVIVEYNGNKTTMAGLVKEFHDYFGQKNGTLFAV